MVSVLRCSVVRRGRGEIEKKRSVTCFLNTVVGSLGGLTQVLRLRLC